MAKASVHIHSELKSNIGKPSRILTAGFITLAIVSYVTIAIFVLQVEIRDVFSDPHSALITSQSIIENGTNNLDHLRGYDISKINQIKEINGHLYDHYPIGTPLFSLPFVAIAHFRGMDMVEYMDNAIVQIWIITFTVPVIFVLLFAIGRHILSLRDSFIITLVTFFGSSLSSTLATALWSHDFVTLLGTIILLLLIRFELGYSKSAHPFVLGLLFILSFITRPTASLLILVSSGYLFYRDRNQMIKAAIVSALGLLLFMWHTYYTQGTILPAYYLTPTGHHPPFIKAYYWLLMSPSRGLLVFSPWIALTIGLLIALRRDVMRQPLVIMSFLWGVLLLALLARTSFWYGGWSFGPRLQGDILPGVVLVTFLTWHAVKESGWAVKVQKSIIAVFIVLGIISGFIHVRQGLFSGFPQYWNQNPYIVINDETTIAQVLNDWEYPQFLASRENLEGLWNKYYREETGEQVRAVVRASFAPSPAPYLRDRTMLSMVLYKKHQP